MSTMADRCSPMVISETERARERNRVDLAALGYATQQVFGGQRAAQTRAVIVKLEGCCFAGKIVAIRDDHPCIILEGDPPGRPALRTLRFHATEHEADLALMPNDAWTWPPRV